MRPGSAKHGQNRSQAASLIPGTAATGTRVDKFYAGRLTLYLCNDSALIQHCVRIPGQASGPGQGDSRSGRTDKAIIFTVLTGT
jgi:hypothetical protein